MFIPDPPIAVPALAPDPDPASPARPRSRRRSRASRLTPACHAYIERWLGPVDTRPDWLRDAPLRDTISAAYLRCLIDGEFGLAVAFREAATEADRRYLRDNLEHLLPPGLVLPPLPYVRSVL